MRNGSLELSVGKVAVGVPIDRYRFLQATRLPLQMNAAVGASGYSEETGRDLLIACALQVTRVKRIALVKIADLVAAAKPAGALFGSAVRK
jgi:hypothetical protein